MKRLALFLILLFIGVLTTACVNTFAIHELNENAARFIQKEDYAQAISRLTSALDLDENVYETRYNLAVAYLGQNDCEMALKNILEAQKLQDKKNTNSNLYYTKGVVYDCMADNLKNPKNTENNPETAQNEDFEENKNNATQTDFSKEDYINYLKEAIKNYEIYLKQTPDAGDKNSVVETIEEDKSKIEEIENEIMQTQTGEI